MAVYTSAPSRAEAIYHGSAAVALLGAALIGMRVDISYGVTAGGIYALAMLPIWTRTLVRSRSLLVISFLAILCVGSGYLLTQANGSTHATNSSDLLSHSAQLVQLAATTAFLVWAFSSTSVSAATVAFGVGAVAGIPFNESSDPNLWRFTLSIPLTMLILALASLSRGLTIPVVALVGLAVVGFVNDSRSNSSFLLLAAVVLVWQRIARTGSRRGRGFGGAVTLVVSGLLLANLVQSAILDGYFGEVTRQRTEMQIEQSGNVVFGGRPEIAASAALIGRYPFGLGSGTIANYQDIQAASQSMLGIGYDPDNYYVQKFMFGQTVEVHSVIGDLWIWFGIAGLVFGAACATIFILGSLRGYGAGSLAAVYLYIVLRATWDLFFSPFASAVRLWPLALALSIAYVVFQKVRGQGASLHAFDRESIT